MGSDELCFLSLSELADEIRRGRLSPVEVVEAHLDRIARIDPQLNAFITVCAEEVRAAASAAQEEIANGQYRGPLHGIPFGAKDIFDTEGIRTTQGSAIFRDNFPEQDAESIRRLKASGALLVGKCNTHEFAAGSTTSNPHFGTCRNPWDLGRVPGGSSGGSAAAVAASLCPAATATETSASIRGPASLCGVIGLKPTYGRISLRGIYPNARSIDHAGLMARTTRDCGLFLQEMAGYDLEDPASVDVPVPDFCAEIESGVDGLRMGLCEDLTFVEIDSAVREAFNEAVDVLRHLGAEVRSVEFPLAERLNEAREAIANAEYFEVHRARFSEHPEGYGEDLRPRLEKGAQVTLDAYIRALRERELVRRAMADLFHSIDAILLPGYPCVAARIDYPMVPVNGKELPFSGLSRPLVGAHNLTGFPALSIPTGLSPESLPVSMQIVCSPWQESRLLRIAYAYEQATPEIRSRRPPAV